MREINVIDIGQAAENNNNEYGRQCRVADSKLRPTV
jgi:hypothetical protein